ncbi:MAG: sulfur carrier protein ThiS [Gammaproteobacteria bacterium]|nr:sulfur carrier protein ThiS [Gammaproteobacteria bacterium]
MNVIVNGVSREVETGETLASLVAALQLADKRIAIEVNEEIVPRSGYDAHRLHAGDRVEVVTAIGGG